MGKLCVCVFFLLLTLATINHSSGCFDHEWRALLQFKRSLASDSSGLLSSWNGNKCCEWQGVGCDNATRHVTRFHLGSDPWGSIPRLEGNKLDSCLAELTRLSYIDLSGNDFRGSPIPEFIGSMTQLRFLNLSFAGFSGVVPHVIGNLSSLRILDLSYTNLVVDDFTWFSSLVSLQHLDLSALRVDEAWNLDKVLLYKIPSLRSLHLSGCKLSNSHFTRTHLDSNITLSTIQTLDLSLNSFQGEFPRFLQNLTSLRVLDLSTNNLNSSIPVMNNIVELNLADNSFPSIQDVGVWRICQLKRLDLTFNDMPGGLTGPSSNASECARFAMETLILSYNRFGGKIPTSLQRLTALRGLYLAYNELTGTIPETLGNITSLRELDLSGNQLTGSIPTSLGNLMVLQTLDLSWNLLNRAIPFSLGRLSNLENLYLSYNSLSAIPLSLGNLSQLQVLDLSSNILQGSLPRNIGKLSKLEGLYISNNSLSGVVTEEHFVNTSMLKHLIATSNHGLNFKFSPDWKPPFQITTIRLGSCTIQSEFPKWIRTQRSLVILDLSNTNISGPLPYWLRELPIINVLDLSHNFLDGPLTNLPFTQTIKSLKVTDSDRTLARLLLLKNNLFTGSIPESLCNATDLSILDLSRNMLSGTLPECIGDLCILKAMILSSKRLSGVNPSSLGNIGSSLQWLQLNNNSFHGQLPNLANCTGLNLLDLGENRFSGSIPKWIGDKIKSLVVLRLHENSFSGQIPVELCESSELQIMDLGVNNLTGTIPFCFLNFSGMTRTVSNFYFSGGFDHCLTQVVGGHPLEYTTTMRYVVNMDLSSNKLIGEIPNELVLLSGLLGLNLSNNHLTGRIPDRIGDMHSLISLDLSGKNLSGLIPQSMSTLTFLSHLNLSHNNLSGRVPTGAQLQTLIDPSIYAGNNQLCGGPLPIKCNDDQIPIIGRSVKEDEDDDSVEKMWIYGVTSGFITGFMGILGILALMDRWRRALFNLLGACIGREL